MAQLPEYSRPLYRICTRKSRLGFGKYSDLYTVGDILKADPKYIVWAYTSCENISFAQDILDELNLPLIKKPGTDKDVYFDWLRSRSAQFSKEERMHGAAKKKMREKKSAIASYIRVRNSVSLSKGQLQAINHGHFKK